ncbi:MAG TPA: tRNA-dihydrouridine synthase [Candidatus Binatia bacterium]
MNSFWQSIPKPIVGLSPMDGVTDAAFRYIAARHGGPDVTLTEFVNVVTAVHAPGNFIRDLTYSEIERPAVAQVYGHEPDLFYKVAHLVCELGFDGLDINMGCPAKKVVGKGGGAALIRTPALAASIIQSARRGIQDWVQGQRLEALGLHPQLAERVRRANLARSGTDTPTERRLIPVSVKTRLGYDRVVVEDWIQALLEEKPRVISLHGRTLKQMYKGEADWEAIGRAAALARNSSSLILGNGDLKDMGDVYRRVSETGVDGVLLGRSALGNPWIFRGKNKMKTSPSSGAARFPEQEEFPCVPLEERVQVILEHCAHFEKYSGAPSFVGMRKHLAWYCKGFRGASEMRSRMVRANSAGDVARCLQGLVPFNVDIPGVTGRPFPQASRFVPLAPFVPEPLLQ